MIQSISARQAKKYFTEALGQSDYYVNAQEFPGHIRGRLAARLGIDGMATKSIFESLAENTHPQNGQKLTPRQSERRTVGYDINFHCPKSVSILHALSTDNHILDAFQHSVTEIMADIEHDSKTRKRKAGHDEDISTGELVWADFIHQTARPVDGAAPDPHLHSHCFTFNMTWDDSEKRYKAAQFRDIKRDMPYYQAKFHKVLSDRLYTLGYTIRKTDAAFEIDGVPQEVIDRFSKRTDEIGQAAQASGITDAKELDKLGGRTRARKQKGMTMDDLKKDWRRQIRSLGLNQAQSRKLIRKPVDQPPTASDATQCLDHAIDHCFERASVVQDRRLLAKAFQFSIGNPVTSPAAIQVLFDSHAGLYKGQEGAKSLCTTWDIIREERDMISLAQAGVNGSKPFYETLPAIPLDGEQGSAIADLLSRQDRVMIVEGRAGTGKTTLMKTAISLIEQSGKTVFVAAPSSEASRGVLREEGFAAAETVAKLLTDRELQDGLKDQVLWVDEAGLLGVKDMTALLALAYRLGARLILSGDTRQHSSVARGDALRVLKDLGGVWTTSLTDIRRQKHAGYKKAVQAISKGDVAEGFDVLDTLGFIQSVEPGEQAKTMAHSYVQTIKTGKSALIVSPTHKQGLEVTEAVREALKRSNKIGKTDHTVMRLIPSNMTEADRSDPRNYKKGHVIRINQNKPGMSRGSTWFVRDIEGRFLRLMDEQGREAGFAVETEKDFEVYQQADIPLAKGDSIRITRNGFDDNKQRLNNGQALKIVSINKKGNIVAQHPTSKKLYQLPRTFGHIDYGYCLTSHASQGKTVDEIFIYQPASTFPATDLKQFYVSVSRGRDKVHLYTDDKETLIGHASNMRSRQSGLELVGLKEAFKDIAAKKDAYPLTRQSRPLHTLSF